MTMMTTPPRQSGRTVKAPGRSIPRLSPMPGRPRGEPCSSELPAERERLLAQIGLVAGASRGLDVSARQPHVLDEGPEGDLAADTGDPPLRCTDPEEGGSVRLGRGRAGLAASDSPFVRSLYEVYFSVRGGAMAPGGVTPVLSGRSEECARLGPSSPRRAFQRGPTAGPTPRSRQQQVRAARVPLQARRRVPGRAGGRGGVGDGAYVRRSSPLRPQGAHGLGITSRRQFWAVPS